MPGSWKQKEQDGDPMHAFITCEGQALMSEVCGFVIRKRRELGRPGRATGFTGCVRTHVLQSRGVCVCVCKNQTHIPHLVTRDKITSFPGLYLTFSAPTS